MLELQIERKDHASLEKAVCRFDVALKLNFKNKNELICRNQDYEVANNMYRSNEVCSVILISSQLSISVS